MENKKLNRMIQERKMMVEQKKEPGAAGMRRTNGNI